MMIEKKEELREPKKRKKVKWNLYYSAYDKKLLFTGHDVPTNYRLS